ncbi:7TM diverse intracellular signaling domain-containing protein [Aquimarina litoralis]|uniref:7TM diverse intracellular signaling domain-containing protein n=1 Tax=Aquimarina litoralis TaxID=584605 RepID=UPI001C563A67|nr:7TM diverse intracellular signaling domain-containing protein [Aquimarina litoralis]MBW1296394.1 hypothetical protein [Aquimarina litoralis]
MRLKERSLLFSKILLIGIAFFFIRGCLSKRHDVITSDNEYITLSPWNAQKTEKLILNIKPLFYWKQWPVNTQGIFNDNLLKKPDTLNSTAIIWTKIGHPPKGFGTYRFFIKQKDLNKEAVLNLSRVLGACEVWINGEKQVAHGKISKNLIDSEDDIPPLVVELPNEELLDVMLLVSSANSRLGGGFPLQNSIDEKERFFLIKKRKFAYEGLMTILILIFGGYQIFIYRNVHREKYFLYFGLFCLSGGARQLFVGEAFVNEIFPNISFEVVQRLRYICFYSGLGFLFLYHHYLFPRYFSRKIVILFTVVPALGVVYILSTSVFYGTYSAPIFQIFGLLNVIAGFWLIIKAIKDNRPFAKLILLNLVILSTTFTNDILNAMMLRQTGFVVIMGLLTYVILQLYLNHKITKKREAMLLDMTLEVEKMNEKIQNNEARISKLLHESYYHLKSKKELADNLKKIKRDDDDTVSINSIVSNLRSELVEDNQLNTIKNDIEILNYDYLQRLKAKAPNLTDTDLEICIYFYIGLNRKEICRLRGTSIEAIRKSRYRIRKKLELAVDDDLEDYLKNI